jgi:Zn-dependent protease with chaperone function
MAALCALVALAPRACPAQTHAADSVRAVTAFADTALADSAARDSAQAVADSLAALPPAPPDYVAEVRARFTPENRTYQRTQTALAFLEPFYGLLAGIVVLFSGLSARMRDIAHALGTRRYVRVLVYLALYSAVGFVIALPLEWYRGFALEHQYHLSTETLGSWMLDQLKSLAFSIGTLGLIPLLALAYGAMEKWPRAWWLWLAGGLIPVTLAATLLQPLVFEPAFNKFTPLRDPVLKARILSLAERAGIPSRRVFEVDKSKQTNKVNAYVSGFGASQRIVLWDTTLERMKPDEILFVMGHEMGHYRLGHIWKSVAISGVAGFAFCFALFLVVTRATRRFGPRWGFDVVHDVASMPLLAVSVSLLSFVASPAINAFSREIEHEADGFGLEVTRDNDAAARAFIVLGSENRSDPEPSAIVTWFLYSHPPLIERVRFATEYRPWERGEPNRWFHPVRR